MQEGERQVAPTRDGIRRDHVARYEWAARILEPDIDVLDLACGVGYGSQLLAHAGMLRVRGVDCDAEAIEYASQHYAHPRVRYCVADARDELELGEFDAAVCFETIEHLQDPAPLLRNLARMAPRLLASVPNETEFPWRGHKFHFRHYTREQFEALLNSTGWEVASWWGQAGAHSEVEAELEGRTLIVDARRSARRVPVPVQLEPLPLSQPAPAHVAICALGPSVNSYVELCKRLGGRRKFSDETWGINAIGDVLACDRLFHMDDVRVQEARAAAEPGSNIAAMLEWLRRHPGPIYTSRPHPDYPGMTAYPLEAVVRATGFAYFNNTAAYAVAFALLWGVKKLSLFGMDFTYANSHHAEKGRACVEFWLGQAAARGMKLSIPQRSSLMDGCEPERGRPYGFDTLEVAISGERDNARVSFVERERWPTADEIEHRYDHTRHVSPLVEAAGG